MIYVLMPAFNEAAHLAALLPTIPERLEEQPVQTIVVCDGSTDGTCQVAEDNGAEVVALWPNSGKGVAVRAGAARLADRDFKAVVMMDGDGQHDPHDLPALVRPILAGECDIAVGSRYMTDPGRGTTPLNRYLVRTFFTRILRGRLEQPVTDPFGGYRCMSPRAFRRVRISGDRYEGEIEVRFEAAIHGLELCEVPVAKIYAGGQSKMGATRGPLLGRLRVVRGYARTVRRKTRELTAAGREASVA